MTKSIEQVADEMAARAINAKRSAELLANNAIQVFNETGKMPLELLVERDEAVRVVGRLLWLIETEYSLDSGHIGRDARAVLAKLTKEGRETCS